MPQMSPMSWLPLVLFFMLFMFFCLIYFLFMSDESAWPLVNCSGGVFNNKW